MPDPSKTPSDSFRPPEAEPKPTLLLDQTFSSQSLAALLAADDWAIELHKNHWAGDAKDHEWIPPCAERGWWILSCDKRIHRWKTEHGLARRAALENCAKVFFIARGSRSLPEYAAAVIRAKKKMFNMVRKNRGGPLFVRILGSGEIEPLFLDNLTQRDKTRQKYGRVG